MLQKILDLIFDQYEHVIVDGPLILALIDASFIGQAAGIKLMVLCRDS